VDRPVEEHLVRETAVGQAVQAEPDHRDAAAEQYERLTAELTGGVHPPGTLLLETAVAAAHQVSRTPVREALARLEQDGVLRRVSRGYLVRERTAEEILELYELRMLVEGHGAMTAAKRATEIDLARLRLIQAEAHRCQDVARLGELDLEFHYALQLAWHSEATVEASTRLLLQTAVYPLPSAPDLELVRRNVDDHNRLLSALEQGDGDAARLAAIHHLRRIRDLRIERMLADGSRPSGRRVASGG
jgi:DNA-binding GntR family transcriptional regulator